MTVHRGCKGSTVKLCTYPSLHGTIVHCPTICVAEGKDPLTTTPILQRKDLFRTYLADKGRLAGGGRRLDPEEAPQTSHLLGVRQHLLAAIHLRFLLQSAIVLVVNDVSLVRKLVAVEEDL